MTIAPFQQFIAAMQREIERREIVLASYSRLLSDGELMKLNEDERREYWSRHRYGAPRPRVHPDIEFDFTRDDTQRDYDRDDGVRQNYEHAE